ncbi:DUF2071 domain-containing protein [Nocardioides nanhaiensis]
MATSTTPAPRAEPVDPHAPRLTGPRLMNQDWRDLLYVHWAVEPARLVSFMPPGVRPDEHEGLTYVGLVPFRMVDAGFGPRSSVPFFGTFLETNVRLYSMDERGRRGVVFLSLDADRLAVVLGARASLGIPYRWATMSHAATAPTPADQGGDGVAGAVHAYRSRLRRRVRVGRPEGRTDVRVRVGAARTPTPLDHFVSARWRLHTGVLGRTIVVPNQHEPWPLHEATLEHLDAEVLASVGLPELVDREPDHVAFSPGVHTEFGLPRR